MLLESKNNETIRALYISQKYVGEYYDFDATSWTFAINPR